MKKLMCCLLCVLTLLLSLFFSACGEDDPVYYIGDSAKSEKGVEYTVTKVTNAKSYVAKYNVNGLSIDPETRTTENNYVIVEIKVINHSTGNIDVGRSGNTFYLYTYLKMGDAQYGCEYAESSKYSLIPEESCTLFLVYETIYTSIEREYILSIEFSVFSWNEDSTVKIILKNSL